MVGGWGRQQGLHRVLMDDQDLSGGEKGTRSKPGSINEDHKGKCAVQQSLHPSGQGKSSLFWLMRDFFPP